MNSNSERWMMRMMIVFLIVILAILNASQFAFSDDRARLRGIWKLVPFEGEFSDMEKRLGLIQTSS